MIDKETLYALRDARAKTYMHGWDRTEREHFKAGYNAAIETLFPIIDELQKENNERQPT